MKKVFLCSMLAILLSGCATIFTRSSDPITFKSVPEGAKIEIDGANYGKTPVTVPIKRSVTPPQVQFKLNGYDSRQVMLQNSFNGVSFLNIFFWPGFLLDALTGSMMKYEVRTYEVELDPSEKKQTY